MSLPLFKGQGKEAKESYVQGIVDVLKNYKKYLQNDYDIFLVANGKYNRYPKIAAIAEMKNVNQFKQPVLYRAEKDRSTYAEIIFDLKQKEYCLLRRKNHEKTSFIIVVNFGFYFDQFCPVSQSKIY